ncbi:MAG: flagellar filament capping protein FliD [Planctomycetota bacterium]
MTRITSTGVTTSTGLVSGIPIEDTVNQLIQLSAQPRDSLQNRTDGLRSERAAVDQLAAQVLSFQSAASGFSRSATYTGRSAVATGGSVEVSVASGETPSLGSYQFTPLQTASANQYVSDTYSSVDDILGSGSLRLGFGSRVDQGVALAELNDGSGIASGRIKITDKNGDSAVVDLRAARTVDDVLEAINTAIDIDVTATANADSFTLTDNTGGAGTLRIRDVGGGTTAADLGLADLAASGGTTSVTGSDVYTLSAATTLATLNDGNGIDLGNDAPGIDDLDITLRDGTTKLGVDLTGAETLGDVIDAINNDADNGGSLTAAISADGFGLTLTDNTAGSGNLIVTSEYGSAESLGVDTGTAGVASSTVEGRLASGLADTLVRSLNGGAGLTLGQIDVTDRAGATQTIDLSAAETLQEVLATINGTSGISVTAQINSAGSGIELTDTSGGSGNLVVAENGSTTAADLGLTNDSAVTSVDGGGLSRQSVSRSTQLTSLNGGAGVELGDIRITDSAGATTAIDLNTSGDEAETVGDVIDRINSAATAGSLGVKASINATGDGILLTDSSTGSGSLTVAEVGSGSAAADLNLLGASSTTNGNGEQTIDGAFAYSIDLSDLSQSTTGVQLSSLNSGSGVDSGVFEITDSSGATGFVNLGEAGSEAFTVADVISKINAAGVGVTAALNSGGTGVELTDTAGGSGTLTVDDLGSGTAAADLNLLGESATQNSDNQQTINSGFLFSSDSSTDGFDALVDRINELEAGVTASVLSDESGSRIVLTSASSGAAGGFLVEANGSPLSFTETSRGEDAAAVFGPPDAGVVVRSSSNTFNSVVDGLNITVDQADGATATIDVASDDAPLLGAAQSFVDSYNSLRSSLDGFTSFDDESLTTGILFGRSETLRVDADLSRILSGRAIFGVEYGSLESVGISLNDDGTLALDRSKLSEAFADDPSGVERLFTDDASGVVQRVSNAVDQLAANENSLLSSRSDALERTITANDERITALTDSLDRERERLLLDFIRLEETIALLQSNTSAIESIQPITIANSSS